MISSNHNLLVIKADDYTGYPGLSGLSGILKTDGCSSYLPSSGGEVIPQLLASDGSVD